MLCGECVGRVGASFDLLPKDSGNEIGALGEMPINGADPQACAIGDVTHGRVNASFGKHLLRSLEQREKVPLRVGAHAAPCRRRSMPRLPTARYCAHQTPSCKRNLFRIYDTDHVPFGAEQEFTMEYERIALVTGANQGVGFQVAKELVASGATVLIGSRHFERGEAAAKEIGAGAIALQLDVTDKSSIDVAAERVRREYGRVDLLVNNAAISNTKKGDLSLEEYGRISRASNASLDEVRAVWETNVFGVLAVYQAMLPLLRNSEAARIVNVSSGVGSLTLNADPAYPYHAMFAPGYPASKAALNAMTLAMMVELEGSSIKVNLVTPGFTSTNLNGYEGTQSVEDGSREVVRVALLGPDGPPGTFTRWENVTIPW